MAMKGIDIKTCDQISEIENFIQNPTIVIVNLRNFGLGDQFVLRRLSDFIDLNSKRFPWISANNVIQVACFGSEVSASEICEQYNLNLDAQIHFFSGKSKYSYETYFGIVEESRILNFVQSSLAAQLFQSIPQNKDQIPRPGRPTFFFFSKIRIEVIIITYTV